MSLISNPNLETGDALLSLRSRRNIEQETNSLYPWGWWHSGPPLKLVSGGTLSLRSRRNILERETNSLAETGDALSLRSRRNIEQGTNTDIY